MAKSIDQRADRRASLFERGGPGDLYTNDAGSDECFHGGNRSARGERHPVLSSALATLNPRNSLSYGLFTLFPRSTSHAADDCRLRKRRRREIHDGRGHGDRLGARGREGVGRGAQRSAPPSLATGRSGRSRGWCGRCCAWGLGAFSRSRGDDGGLHAIAVACAAHR